MKKISQNILDKKVNLKWIKKSTKDKTLNDQSIKIYPIIHNLIRVI